MCLFCFVLLQMVLPYCGKHNWGLAQTCCVVQADMELLTISTQSAEFTDMHHHICPLKWFECRAYGIWQLYISTIVVLSDMDCHSLRLTPCTWQMVSLWALHIGQRNSLWKKKSNMEVVSFCAIFMNKMSMYNLKELCRNIVNITTFIILSPGQALYADLYPQYLLFYH